MWLEFGLVVFLLFLYKINFGFGIMRSEVSMVGCLWVNSFWKIRESVRGRGYCFFKRFCNFF